MIAMAQRSIPYAVARIRALENRLLDAQTLARLRDADRTDALKLLLETGYGQGAAAEDAEAAIAAELLTARRLVREVSPDPEVTGLFLLGIDARNLKTLLKARLLNQSAEGLLGEGGMFPLETLKRAVADKDYRDLPPEFSRELNAVERRLAVEPDPQMLSAAVDRAAFAYIDAVIRRSGDTFARSYFAAQADFLNVRSLLRARALGWDAERLRRMLVSGGEISLDALADALHQPDDQLSKRLASGANGRAIGAALEEYAASGSLAGLERSMDAALMTLARSAKAQSFSSGPVIGYLLGREAEAKALRLIFAAKQAGREASLPELYS